MKFIFLGIILFWTNLNAEITSEEVKFSSLCIEEGSTGFLWRNGKWKQTTFFTKKYLYKKIDSPNQYCKNTKIDKWNIDKKYKTVVFSEGCYEVGEFGEKYRRTEQCEELWYLHPNGNTELNFVRCSGVEFQPNGNFAKSNHHTEFNDFNSIGERVKHRDSLFVSHGKCSRL